MPLDQSAMIAMMSENYLKSMEKMMALVANTATQPKTTISEEVCTKAEEVVMVDIKNHHVKDNANDQIDYVVRTKMRPINAWQVVRWKEFPRVARPVRHELGLEFLMKDTVNPKVVGKLHDRGAALNLEVSRVIRELLKGQFQIDACYLNLTQNFALTVIAGFIFFNSDPKSQ